MAGLCIYSSLSDSCTQQLGFLTLRPDSHRFVGDVITYLKSINLHYVSQVSLKKSKHEGARGFQRFTELDCSVDQNLNLGAFLFWSYFWCIIHNLSLIFSCFRIKGYSNSGLFFARFYGVTQSHLTPLHWVFLPESLSFLPKAFIFFPISMTFCQNNLVFTKF